MSRLSWKWRKRPSVKITERTYEERTKAFHSIDVLAGRQQQIHAERDRKLEAARKQRQSHRQQAA
jgi:hypothetical protein